ncbi:MAG TPA: tetratricopeptide repeat protein, partial [Anaerolineae bacterium]|nr:tetratricopeptide repeat protein [Anaerolineae bacterium]
MLVKPQPIGIFPLPASYLLLPAVADDKGALAHLLQGRVPEIWPEEWTFYRAALLGEAAVRDADEGVIGR